MGRPRAQSSCHPDDKAVGRGMCRKCYSKWWKGKKYPTKAKKDYGRSDNSHAMALRQHGLTIDEYWARWDLQAGRCAVCGNVETSKLKDTVKRLAVDHDHDCCPGDHSCGSCVRGLLCYRCNMMLGFGQDSPDIMRSAAIYLERTASA